MPEKKRLGKKNTAVHQKEWVSAEKKYSRKKKYRCPAKGVSEWLYYLFPGKKKYDTFVSPDILILSTEKLDIFTDMLEFSTEMFWHRQF